MKTSRRGKWLMTWTAHNGTPVRIESGYVFTGASALIRAFDVALGRN